MGMQELRPRGANELAQKRAVSLLLLLAFLVGPAIRPARANGIQSSYEACVGEAVGDALETATHVARPIETLDDLLHAFSQGLKPDLSNAQQRDAFELYRKMRFGNPNTSLNAGTTDEIAKALKAHPELEKEPFRNFKLSVEEKSYPVTAELKKFTDGQVSSAGQVRSNLFQIDANAGFWKKLLQYSEEQIPKTLTKEEQKALAAEQKARWSQYLSSKISPEVRAQLVNEKLSAEDRGEILYHVLVKERGELKAAGKDTRAVSQAIVDLVHTIGYFDASIAKRLKSTDGLVRLEAYQQLLSARDHFAMKLGYENHFEQVLKEMNVAVPTGVPSAHGTTDTLKEFEKAVVSGAVTSSKGQSERTIRHLSLTESPYRSCLGGSDCSSRTYLTKALDPNYHYFTITDETGASTGHITVVLGEAEVNGQKVKMAFIDKVQNVPNADIPVMMEGMRRSLAEKGYKLALPKDIGDHNGLSNEDITRSFVKSNIKVNEHETLANFTPHTHKYSFPNKYSRAGNRLPSSEVLPLNLAGGVSIKPAEVVKPWKPAEGLDLKKLVEASSKLKHSADLKDRLRYIPSMKAIEDAKLGGDSEFDATLTKWISDPNESFQLRKQALLFKWTDRFAPLDSLLLNFTPEERVQLLQNLLDTPRYRERLANNPDLAALSVMARANKKVSGQLLDIYAANPLARTLSGHVLESGSIADSKALELTKALKAGLTGSPSIDSILEAQKLARGTSLEKTFGDELLAYYVNSINSGPALGRALSKALHADSAAVRDFGNRLIAKSQDPAFVKYPVLKAFDEIRALQTSGGHKDFHDAAKAWLASSDGNPQAKADFLVSNFGGDGGHLFDEYRNAIPKAQLDEVVAGIDRETNLGAFERLAAKNPQTLKTLFSKAKIEAFEFRMHAGGKTAKLGSPATEAGRGSDEVLRDVTLTKPFEMQATPVTQMQWALVMGENPSNFKSGTSTVTMNIGSRDVVMNPNRPVEQVSWNDVQTFIAKMNELDPHHTYRLPTEAEWEMAARAGTTTAYAHGDDVERLGEHAWSYKNSGNQTHDVAELKPNGSGLYDMHGNVWEWCQDWYGPLQAGSVTDPLGPSSGSARVLRGGGWNYDPQFLRSARRGSYSPGNRSYVIGFRLVRTPK